MEFRSGCGQMDLTSAYVLHPLNHLVLDSVMWNRGRVNEQRSGGMDRRCWRGPESEGRSQGHNINWGRGS